MDRRRSPAFGFLRGVLPNTFTPSKDDPTRSNLAWYDALELFLLRLDDEAWNNYEMQRNLALLAEGRPIGYSNVDAALAERQRKRGENGR